MFIDAFVTRVTLRRLRVEGAGSSGIYLEAGSRDNVVVDNEIVGNGVRESGPGGQAFSLGNGTNVWFWGTGRETTAPRSNRARPRHPSERYRSPVLRCSPAEPG
jgi:hypothetical protein